MGRGGVCLGMSVDVLSTNMASKADILSDKRSHVS